MKHLKIYENFDELKKICDKIIPSDILHGEPRNTYKINDDLSVDVNNDYFLHKEYCPNKEIPIKFNKINGCFDCCELGLTDLKNCPVYVSEHFWCYGNKLTTLERGPKYVGGSYACNNNKLTDVFGFPESFTTKNYLSLEIKNNPICEILSLATEEKTVSFIHLLNDYSIIRNSDKFPYKIIIKSRLEDALYEIGIKEFNYKKFKHYRLR